MVKLEPKNGHGGDSNVTAEHHKMIKLLDKYLCVQCQKWKTTQQFSKKQLSTYQWKVANMGAKVNGATAELRCRICVGEQVTELHCSGPCHMYKGLDQFSKTQRTHPETAWCMTCTQWKEACEPEVAVQVHPNGTLSKDEEREAGIFSIGVTDIEGEYSDSEDDFENDGIPYSSVAAISIRDKTGSLDLSAGYGPAKKSNVGNTLSARSSQFASPSDYGGEAGENQEFKSSQSGLNAEQESGSGWSVVDARRNTQKPGIAYNAYDSAGNLHEKIRTPSTTVSAPNTQSNVSGNQATPKISVGRSGWVRRSTRKTPLPSFPAIARPQGRRSYDDDESADEM